MNKNLILSVPDTFDEIIPPDFDNAEECADWIVYQLKEINLIIECFIHHRTKTVSISNHINLTRDTLMNCWKRFRNQNIDQELVRKIQGTLNLAVEYCIELSSIPRLHS